jgi:hypothetical protein
MKAPQQLSREIALLLQRFPFTLRKQTEVSGKAQNVAELRGGAQRNIEKPPELAMSASSGTLGNIGGHGECRATGLRSQPILLSARPGFRCPVHAQDNAVCLRPSPKPFEWCHPRTMFSTLG